MDTSKQFNDVFISENDGDEVEGIRLLLVNYHQLVRSELRQILELDEGIKVVGEVGSGEEAVMVARQLTPDVILVLTDEHMPGMNGTNIINAIGEAHLSAKAIIITEDVGRYLVPAIKAGVAGILPRSIIPDELTSSIRKIYLWSCDA